MKNAWAFKEASCLLHEGSSTCRKALESICLAEAFGRWIPVLLKDSGKVAMTAAPAIHSWTHTEKVFCWPGDWLLLLLALKEGLNMLMECSDLRLYADSWNSTYMSNQCRLPLPEANNMWGIEVRVSVWKPAKSISVKTPVSLEATMRYLNLDSVTELWKHFILPPKQILCTRLEAFWGLHGTCLTQAQMLTVYYTFLSWGSIHLEQQ